MNWKKPLDGMLMETTNKEITNLPQKNLQEVFYVNDEPVMKVSIDLIEKLGKFGKVILRAKGDLIPNAVSISNILTEKMMKGNSAVQKITLDSEIPKQLGRMTSTIEIILVKK